MSGRKKTGKAKLWRSIWLVMKKKFQSHLTSFDLSKIGSAKIASTKSAKSAKMLKKICVKKEDVKKCPVEKKLVKQSCGEVSV